MKFTKKPFFISLLTVIFVFLTIPQTAYASFKIPFDLASDSVFLLNMDTNTVLFEKNSKKINHPASLTKIMTAIIALEEIDDLEKTVVAPSYIYDEFAGISVSTADIRAGESVKMIDLLYSMVLQSACESSSIIADYIGDGSIPQFIDMMNKKAIEIGAKDTVFGNAHGLYHKDQVTTAYDMALITQYALKIPMFEKIATTESYLMPATNKHKEPRYVIHTNYMLNKSRGGKLYYPYAKGIKTGSIPEVGRNLVSTASKDGNNYLLVTIGAPTKDEDGKSYPVNKSFEDAYKLYEWAFNEFSPQTVVKENDILSEANVSLGKDKDFVSLVASKDVITLLPNNADLNVMQKNITLSENIKAPIKKGDVLGVLDLKLSDSVIARVDLIAKENVPLNLFLYAIDVSKQFFSQSNIQFFLGILLLLILFYIVLIIRHKNKVRKSKTRRRQYLR